MWDVHGLGLPSDGVHNLGLILGGLPELAFRVQVSVRFRV